MEPLLSRKTTDTETALDPDEAGQWRSPREVAERCIILCCVAAVGEFDPGHFVQWLMDEHLWETTSPLEKRLLRDDGAADQAKISATWRSESLQTLLWAIGKLDSMPPASELVSVQRLLDVMPEPGEAVAEFLQSSALRSEAELQFFADKNFDLRWQIVQARQTNSKPATEAIPGVAYERQYAMNWLHYYWEEPWDEVSTDT